MASPARTSERPEEAGPARKDPRNGEQLKRSVGDSPALGDDERAEEQDAGTPWVYPAVGNGRDIGRAPAQPPDAENRTSGGVEGSRGAIPVSPSDHRTGTETAGSGVPALPAHKKTGDLC